LRRVFCIWLGYCDLENVSDSGRVSDPGSAEKKTGFWTPTAKTCGVQNDRIKESKTSASIQNDRALEAGRVRAPTTAKEIT